MNFNIGSLLSGIVIVYMFKDYQKRNEYTLYMKLIFILDILNRIFLIDMLSIKRMPLFLGNYYSAVIPINVLVFIIIFVSFTFYNSLNAVVQSEYKNRLERHSEFRYLGHVILIILFSFCDKFFM